MYKAMNGPEGEWQDGVFSQAAPWQGYQSSLEEFESGSLGASSRVVPGSPVLRRPLRRTFAPGMRMHTLVGVGQAQSFQDGSLGRTFLRAFPSPQKRRGVRGIGQAYQDGVLGDAVSDAACNAATPCISSLLAVPQPLDRALADPFNQIVAVSLAGIAAYLIFKR